MSNEHSYERLCDYYHKKRMMKELVNFQNALFHIKYESSGIELLLMYSETNAHPNDSRLLYNIFTPAYLYKR